jgi:phosphoribulokinase
MLVAFLAADDDRDDDPTRLDAELTLRRGLPHPDLSPLVEANGDGVTMTEGGSERVLRIPGRIDQALAREIEERIWERMHFATHLRARRLGEFTIGTQLHRSESLALVQLLTLYHLVTAKATVALGADGARTTADRVDHTRPAARARA